MSSPPRPAKQQVVPDRPHKAIGAAAPMAPPRNHHNKNLFAAAPPPEPPVGAMKNLNIGKKMAHGGPVVRFPNRSGLARPLYGIGGSIMKDIYKDPSVTLNELQYRLRENMSPAQTRAMMRRSGIPTRAEPVGRHQIAPAPPPAVGQRRA